MRTIWESWKRAGRLIWEHIVRLVVINLAWAGGALLIVTAGPATLAAYWWIATSVRDGKGTESYNLFFQAVRRFFIKGVIWLVAWAVLLWLAAAGLAVYARLLPPMFFAVVQVFWFYALIYLAAMQPYLLEYLTVEEKPWWASLKAAAWQVIANPLFSHAHLVILGVAIYLAVQFITLWAILLGALVLLFWTVTAADVPWKHGRPKPIQRRIEDVL